MNGKMTRSLSWLVFGVLAVGSWSVSTAGEVSEDEIKQSLAELAPADRALAEVQRYCPVLESQRLGSMGAPVKLMIEGKPVFLCCAACNKKALANRAETVAKVNKLTKIGATLAKLPAEDRAAAEAQRFCAVMAKSPLGSMGAPVKLMIDGQSVFICCEGCRDAALENPRATLAKVKQPSTN